jgi:hypothetical protein
VEVPPDNRVVHAILKIISEPVSKELIIITLARLIKTAIIAYQVIPLFSG